MDYLAKIGVGLLWEVIGGSQKQLQMQGAY
jgi:hypothetical protein